MQEYLIATMVGITVAAIACGMFAWTHKELDDKRQAQLVIQQYIDWLNHEFPEVGRALENLKAEINGEALNAGTPGWKDNCVISGLRQQLRARRLYSTEQSRFAKYGGMDYDQIFFDETVQQDAAKVATEGAQR